MKTFDELAIGSLLGGCRLDDVAGEGGMAIVYRATQIALDRCVAVKVMASRLAEDPKFRERFARESRIASQIDHPNVIPIYNAGEDQGRLFLVMRYVDGSNLQEILLKSGRLDPFRAVHVISQVAAALDVAHARSLVHRDIKPANVLIDGSTGHVYLTDFGLAKEIADASVTQTDHVMGTARYVAPERLRNEDRGTVRGDVYSLGFLLWDLLTGVQRPEPKTVPGVSNALNSVVLKAVALEPMARYASAGDMARAAREALEEAQEPLKDHTAAEASARGIAPPSARGARSAFGPEAVSSGLSDRVRALCETALQAVDDDEARARVQGVRRELDEPLRVAVAGRVSTGKSTLVNAMLGRRIAQTGVGETTRVVAWYRYGSPERVEVRLRNGQRLQRGLRPDGSLPASFEIDAAEIVGVDVWLPIDALKSVTIIDTPGLSSLTDEASGQARVAIGIEDDDDSRAIRQAEALLFAMAGDAHADDEEALRAFQARFRGTERASAVNAIGVLTKADKTGDGSEDPWEAAQAKAERVRQALGPLVSTVVPLVGLLAETANTGSLTEEHAERLRALAALPPDDREELIESPDSLLEAEVPVGVDEREELLDRLGMFGISHALELADAGELTGVGLVRRMRELSGIAELRKHLGGFLQRADALKADAGLTRLEKLSWRSPSLRSLRGDVQRVRREPGMHMLELFRALDLVAVKRIELPDEMMHELKRLVTGRSLAARLGLEDGATTADLNEVASARQRAWKAFENDPSPSPAAKKIAFVVSRSYECLLDQAIEGEGVRA
ncbi:MAG: protein kinase domain-containing protein [Solirubrobacteraceae bacterium]